MSEMVLAVRQPIGQAGAMVGHLATRTLGQYDLPIPRPASDELLVVGANIDALSEEWGVRVADGGGKTVWARVGPFPGDG